MKKFLIVFLVFFVACSNGPEDNNEAIETIETTTTTLPPTTTTTLPPTTTTTLPPTTTTTLPPTTTTTTIPIPQKTIVVLEINVNNPITKIKDVRDAIACGIDK